MSSLVSQPQSGNTNQTNTAGVKPVTQAPAQRLGLIVASLVGIMAAAIAITALLLAFRWGSQPFPGFLVTSNIVVDGSQPLSRSPWSGLNAGIQRLDQIIAVNGFELADNPLETYHQRISELRFGEQVTFDFIRLAEDNTACPPTAEDLGTACRLTLTMDSFGFVPFIGFFIAPFITGVASLLAGFFVLWLRPYHTQAQLISVVAFAQAIFLTALFDLNSTHALIPVWLAGSMLLTASLLHLSMIFPVRSARVYDYPWLVTVPYLLCTGFGFYLINNFFNPPSMAYQQGVPAFLPITVAMVIMLVKALLTRNTAISAVIRDQSNTIVIGLALSLFPALVWVVNLIGQLFSSEALIPFNTSAGTPFSVVAPLSLAYAVLQYKKFDTDRFISSGITYSIMLVALIGGYFLLVFSTTIIFTQELVTITNPLFIGVAIFIIAVGFLPVRNYLQQRIDKLYYRTRHDFQEYTDIFTHEISRENDLNRVVEELRDTLNATIAPSGVFMFMSNHQSGDYVPVGASESETDIVFSRDSGIVTALQADDLLIYLEPNRQWPLEIRSERPRLEILNALLIVGMHGSQQLNGFICIGPPRSGQGVYSYEEMLFIQNLLSQMSVAVERMQVVESLERRVQQLDALRQVSQAANFTITVDYLLELISTQTNRLLAAQNFYIVLYDEKASELYFAFFQEDEERYEDKEMRRWALGDDLYSEIIRTEQPLRVPDFAAAMSQRYADIKFENPRLKAWMGVPLVAGPRRIGVMAVATTHNAQSYGNDQLKTFNDIATLAATSIDKARLFEEAQKRARQLAALNDVSHRLAGELEDIDKLLDLITQNAVDILEAEAGSLLLTLSDGDKKELEFKIAVGPGGSSDLVGTRFAADIGLAGKVATTGRPVIVNDPANDPNWAGDPPDSPFKTSAILAVPLIANNQILGVLEVLNKRDGSPYIQEDVELLTTFAGQAAVAIYNAQLFRMTDQQLSDRVEELETLERIDAELNRSLDASKVAEITIRWAIAKSGATAGVLGLVVGEPPMLHIISRYGYTEDDFPPGADGALWPLDQGVVSRVMRTKRADLVTDVKIDPNYIPSLRKSLSQITVPMLSGGEIIALLVLETNKPPRLNLVDLSFVQRLAEHASIALANAQLYAELTRSNDSKSEFVSFVAHELKQPMTSIKGYTDLLLMGAKMGKLQEEQVNFTNTIKSNIDRMITLVSDLNDVTQLQTNNLKVNPVPLDFQSVLTATLMPIEKQIEDKGQVLHVDVPEDLAKIYGDKNRLIQVLTNLVSNAHKYTPDDGEITLKAEVVPDRWNHSNGKSSPESHHPVLLVSVRDNGIGMSEEDRSKLFTPYFRSSNPEAKAQPGTGLGLTIVRGIVEQHGGSIWVESEFGKGTTFNFTVPIATEEQLAEAETS